MNAQLKRISDCAGILPGYALKARAEHEPEGAFQIIMARHIPGCMPYRYTSEHELRMTPAGAPEKYLVQKGDVLFVSRGFRNCAAVVEDVPERTIASSTFYILRAHSEIDPAYLAWSLNQPAAQAQIGQIRTGAGTPIVQRNVLGEIRIPVPSQAVQRRVAELSVLMSQELKLQKRLLEITELRQRLYGQLLIATLSESQN